MTAPWPIRGVMLDPARLTERFDFYRDLIPDLAAWGYNTILLHLFDDEGSAILLDHPLMLPRMVKKLRRG